MNERFLTIVTSIRDVAVNHRKAIHIMLLICGVFFAYMVHKAYTIETEVGCLQSRVDEHYSTVQTIKRYGRVIFDGLTYGLFAENGMFTEPLREEEFRQGPVADLKYKKVGLVLVILLKNLSGVLFLCLAVMCGIGSYMELKRRNDGEYH